MTEAGRVNRISVAVLVDGSYTKNEKGEVVYQDAPKEELDRIATLVRSAIGFDQKRGDQVEIVNLRFAEAPSVIPSPSRTACSACSSSPRTTSCTSSNSASCAARPHRAVHGRAPAGQAHPGVRILRRLRRAPLPALHRRHRGDGGPPAHPANNTAQMIDIAQVQGQVHAQSVHRVGELADRNPNETASIVRQWLSEPAE